VHGLTISFFTLGRRVHSRVQSFSRTFTAQSGNSRFGTTRSISGRDGANEPSWMSRVKRATRAEDIVINRDDDESPESLAEKGITRQGSDEDGSETVGGSGSSGDDDQVTKSRTRDTEGSAEEDDGTAAMFGAAPDGKVGAGKKEQLRNEKKERKAERDEVDKRESDVEESGGAEVSKEVEDEEDIERGRRREAKHGRDIEADVEREDDDNPPRNILGDLGADADDSKAAQARYKEKMAKAKGKGKDKLKGKDREERSRSRSSSPARRKKPAKRDPRLEARYCRGSQTWQEGRKVSSHFRSVATWW